LLQAIRVHAVLNFIGFAIFRNIVKAVLSKQDIQVLRVFPISHSITQIVAINFNQENPANSHHKDHEKKRNALKPKNRETTKHDANYDPNPGNRHKRLKK
jgi:hypothetical protein